jgi:hypothetical protein
MEMLAGGFGGRAAEIFASARTSDGAEAPYIAALRAKAERAQPKPTDKNPLYAHLGARRCAPALLTLTQYQLRCASDSRRGCRRAPDDAWAWRLYIAGPACLQALQT